MSFSDVTEAKKYASIAEVAAAQAKISESKLSDAPNYAAQAQQSAEEALSYRNTAQESSDNAASSAASSGNYAAQSAESAAQSESAAKAVFSSSVHVPAGETLTTLLAADGRKNKVLVFNGSGDNELRDSNTFASLDSSGKIPVSQIPSIALTEPFVVSSQSEMLALSAQVGDIAKRTDLGYSFCLASLPAATLSNWVQLNDDVLSQLGQSGGASMVGATSEDGEPSNAQIQLNEKVSKASLSGPGGVDLVNGAAKQTDVDRLSVRTTHLEHDSVNVADYADLVVNGDDWTAAIQAAFDTGKVVDGTGVYKVTGPLNTKGQKVIGNWKINATHLQIPVVLDTAVNVNDVGIRMMYVAVHYDYCEFLQIKSLGFNVLHHYCNFSSHVSGAGGTVKKMLDNALTAGMLVQLGTEASALTNTGLTLTKFVNMYDSHPAVLMYSVFDEPGTRGITVSDQDAKITTMRGLTSKPLTCVDLVVKSCPPFYDYWSKEYDIFFVDSYAQRYTHGTEQDKRDFDKEKNRIDVGGVISMSRCRKIIPVTGLFIDHSESGQYTQDKQQGIGNALFFGTKGGGDYGVFVWDSPWDSVGDDRVMNSSDYQATANKLSKQTKISKSVLTESYIFGSAPNYFDFGIADLMPALTVVDQSGIQLSGWSDSYPAKTFISSNSWSGIGYKADSAIFATNIHCRRIVSVYFDCFNINGALPSTCKLQLFAKKSSNNARAITPEFPIGTDSTFIGSSMFANPRTDYEYLSMAITNGVNSSSYTTFVRGLIVCTDW